MRIAHICLSSAFTDGLSYQENILANIHARDGHEVLVVADCHLYENGQLRRVPPEDTLLPSGIRLVRLPYRRIFSDWISEKIKKTDALAPLLAEFRPDVIMFHGVTGWEMRTVGDYRRANPKTRLYLDCHEDRHNSGRNLLSRVLQYKMLTKWLLYGILDQVNKILYVSTESRDFLVEMYGLRDEYLEFYPLGGMLVSPIAKAEKRRVVRERLSIADSQLVYIHSGKLDSGKRTLELLRALSEVADPSVVLLIAGHIPEDQSAALNAAVAADPRVRFLGWRSADELTELMCACDAYLQPGTQSASLQVALCCGLPIMVYPYTSHVPYLRGNGRFVSNSEDIRECLKSFSDDPQCLKKMSEISYQLASELLDYNKLASRVCN